MKKSILCVVLISLLLLCSCKSNNNLEDENIKLRIETILENAIKGDTISLDEVYVNDWDYYIIDSSYDFLSALDDLDVDNADSVNILEYQDNNCIVAFVKDDSVEAYAQITTKQDDGSSCLTKYLYQDKKQVYYKGTILKVE